LSFSVLRRTVSNCWNLFWNLYC